MGGFQSICCSLRFKETVKRSGLCLPPPVKSQVTLSTLGSGGRRHGGSGADESWIDKQKKKREILEEWGQEIKEKEEGIKNKG